MTPYGGRSKVEAVGALQKRFTLDELAAETGYAVDVE